jgi:hypothetical protein
VVKGGGGGKGGEMKYTLYVYMNEKQTNKQKPECVLRDPVSKFYQTHGAGLIID